MKATWSSLGRSVEWMGAVALVFLSLPIIAVTAFLLRAVLIAIVICAVVSCICLYCVSHRFRRWADRQLGFRHQLHLL